MFAFYSDYILVIHDLKYFCATYYKSLKHNIYIGQYHYVIVNGSVFPSSFIRKVKAVYAYSM